jgi:hypothetical protein
MGEDPIKVMSALYDLTFRYLFSGNDKGWQGNTPPLHIFHQPLVRMSEPKKDRSEILWDFFKSVINLKGCSENEFSSNN